MEIFAGDRLHGTTHTHPEALPGLFGVSSRVLIQNPQPSYSPILSALARR
uniref:Uncharacterized protein n=1 Tax=Rhizophora mucronata TaxID=61149 RepID=A0A2P2NJS9_RHIMU